MLDARTSEFLFREFDDQFLIDDDGVFSDTDTTDPVLVNKMDCLSFGLFVTYL
jgi:hypothetical protein